MAFSPQAAAQACLANGRRLLQLASQPLPVPDVGDDLCRSALFTAVAAIDTYMHWLVFQRLLKVRYRSGIPKALARAEIPFSALATLANSAIEAQRNGSRIRPWVQVKNALQNQLLSQTFQSYDQVATAFALSGIDRAWPKVATQLGVQPSDIKQRLNHLVHRRNQIAHEGDIMRMSKPHNVRFNSIDHATVAADVNWVETLLNAMQAVVAAE